MTGQVLLKSCKSTEDLTWHFFTQLCWRLQVHSCPVVNYSPETARRLACSEQVFCSAVAVGGIEFLLITW